MLDFKHIDTVLLDMDGTLLDLHFDNQFWLHLVPQKYAQLHDISIEQAQEAVLGQYQKVYGRLQWYCVDYWQEQLNLPITELKQELKHLIEIRDDVPPFLTALREAGKEVILVTNAHPKSLSLKVEQTNFDQYMDEMLTTHQFGVSKEDPLLWQRLQEYLGYDGERTLFVDDNVPLLHVAQQSGIKHLLAVKNPDSKKPENEITEFNAINDFRTLIAGIRA